VSGEEKRLERTDLAEIKDFFDEKFCLVTDPEPGTALEDYIHGYAKIAEFLSNTTAFREAATSLSTDLALLGTPLFTANVRGAFLYVVGAMAEAYGFSSEIYTLNGKVDPNDFANVLKQKVLFRDTYTRPHGEYSHLIQWLCVARQFDGILNVPVLYKDSVNFACRKGSDFGTLGGKGTKRLPFGTVSSTVFRQTEKDPARKTTRTTFSRTPSVVRSTLPLIWEIRRRVPSCPLIFTIRPCLAETPAPSSYLLETATRDRPGM
jgi:Family of unknown function (DUF5636)